MLDLIIFNFLLMWANWIFDVKGDHMIGTITLTNCGIIEIVIVVLNHLSSTEESLM